MIAGSHLNPAAPPRSPGLNFFVVHQRTAGLPCPIHKVFAFCLLPSRQAATLCHQMDQVPVWGMRRSRCREGMSHGLFSSQKGEICGTFKTFQEPQEPGSKCSCNHPAEMIWDLLCLGCGEDRKAYPFFSSF